MANLGEHAVSLRGASLNFKYRRKQYCTLRLDYSKRNTKSSEKRKVQISDSKILRCKICEKQFSFKAKAKDFIRLGQSGDFDGELTNLMRFFRQNKKREDYAEIIPGRSKDPIQSIILHLKMYGKCSCLNILMRVNNG